MHIVLYHPEIPPNTGNVARLCAATKTNLHLVEPLGFSLDDRYLKRAGLDYWPHVPLRVWPSWEAFLAEGVCRRRLVMSSARGGTAVHRFAFTPEDMIVLGPETTGLPQDVFQSSAHHVRIPIWGEVRSLNMSTAAGILLYQGLATSGLLDQHAGEDDV